LWLTSPRVLPIIMLVVIPVIATALGITLSTFVPFIVSNVGGFPYAFSYVYIISVSSIVYALYPIKFYHLERRGFLNLLGEHTCIKKILYFEIPILITLISIFIILSIAAQSGSGPISEGINKLFSFVGEPLLSGYSIKLTFPYTSQRGVDIVSGEEVLSVGLNGLTINLTFSVTAGIIWMVLFAARKELTYFCARTLFQNITEEMEVSRKAEYLVKAIKLYDKYLRKTLNLEINNAKNIYSKFLSDPKLNENELIQKISKSFDSNNKLKPIKTLSEIMNIKETETFLVDEPIGKKIKDMAIFFATIIPVAVTIIQLLLQTSTSTNPPK
jgi:hypothetical protein